MTARKLMALILSILMIVTMLPTTIFAAPTAVTAGDTAHEHKHEAHDASLAFDGQWVTIVTEVKYGTSADSLPAGANLDYAWAETDKGGYYQLRKNATISATLEMPALERTLDLNGFTLTVEGNIPAFAVNTGTLTIVDSSVTKTGKIVSTGSVIQVGNGTVVLTGGTFEGSKAIDIKSESVTYADLLGENCFYTNGEDDTKITDEATLATASKLKVIKEEEKITITMTDSYSDSWNGAAIEVYKGTTLVDTITVDSDTNTYTLLYDDMSEYIFKWKKGSYDNECSFTIAIGEDVLKTVDSADIFSDGETIYTIESKCEHSVEEPCGACSVCSKVCGTDFDHIIDENRKCSVCSFECGVTAEHDWSGRDGVCKVCGYECPEHSFDENYACTICTYSYKALITSQDGTYSEYIETIDEALVKAAELENSTVKLLDNITTTYCTIDSGKFTIDLNGKTWESSTWVLCVRGNADIKITDSTGEGGLMRTTVAGAKIFNLDGAAKLEIAGGSFETRDHVVGMFEGSSSELLISGGKLKTNSEAILAQGSKVTITGGEFEANSPHYIYYETGTLDLSQYADAEKFVFLVSYSADVSTLNVIIPDGFVLKNVFAEEEVTQLEVGGYYTVTKPSPKLVSVTTQDGTTTTEYASIGEALTAASSLENSTVKLLDNVTTTDYYTIESGKYTIDLNGKIWQSSDVLLYIKGTSQIKICDSSENAGGLMTTSGNALIFLMDETKLEIESGNFSCTGNYIIDTSNYGNETSSELLISGGWFVGNSVASVAGRKATINSGEFDCAWGYPFEYLYGTLDLSNYKGTSEMGFYVPDFTDALALELILPESAIIINCFTEETVTELASGVIYRIEFSEISSIEVDLGEKADEANVRYAEIGGVVTEIEETDNKHLVEIGEENLLVEVTEKTQSGAFVKSQYFYVDMESQTATKLNMDSYMTSDNEKSIRTKGEMGVRFKSNILTAPKNEETDFIIDEYGFVVAASDVLGDTELTLDFSKIATGVAYNKEMGIDRVYDSTSDSQIVFAGVVKNLPVEKYRTDLVCKTYTKITVNGEQFTLYGEAVKGNIYDTAKAALEDDTLDIETRNALYKIVVDYEDSGSATLPGDELFPET